MFKIPREKRSGAPKKNPTKKAFTLAEVMIVLTIIGILSAILLPSAIHSTPDKNILKFKKAHNTLYSAVREMVNSDKYYYSGVLSYPSVFDPPTMFSPNLYRAGWLPDVTPTGIPVMSYFCHVLTDIVSTKKVACDKTTYQNIDLLYWAKIASFSGQERKNYIDTTCDKIATESADELNSILFNDDVLYFEHGLIFGRKSPGTGDTCEDIATSDEFGNAICLPSDGIDPYFGLICLDIDGDGPVKPFGYGIRTDGKIVSGARADWWLSRDITKKETDCCPKDLNDNGLCDEGDTVCE